MNTRKKIILTAVSSAAAAALATGSIFIYTSYKYRTDREEISEYFEVVDYIDKYYYKEPDKESYMDNALKGLDAGLDDEYAAYMTPDEYNSTMENLQGSFAGIGVTVIHNQEKQFVITEITENSPASAADIRIGDLITKVNDVPTNNMDINELVSLVKGEEGTEVTIRIKRDDTESDITLVREEIESDTVDYVMLDDNIAYIKITSFKDVTPQQFNEALDTAINEGAEKIIYDVRNNLGGLLTSCEAVLDPLLPEGEIAYAEYRDGSSNVICRSDKNELDIPSVILVNENTASASELFSSAMRDFGKAELVGTTTYGKGIMQTTIKLSNNGGLRMTIAEYRTANSDCFHEEGLTPDYEIQLPENTDITIPDAEKDPQLKKAIEILK